MTACIDRTRVVFPLQGSDSFDFGFYCPACERGHGFNAHLQKEPKWEFNDDFIWPSIEPSIIVREAGAVCHCHVTNGTIFYHGDSSHALAGQTVPMEPFKRVRANRRTSCNTD